MVVYNNFKDCDPYFLIVKCSVITLCDMSEIVINPIYLPLCATSSFYHWWVSVAEMTVNSAEYAHPSLELMQ